MVTFMGIFFYMKGWQNDAKWWFLGRVMVWREKNVGSVEVIHGKDDKN
jgi:hypothetical protein